MVKTPDKEEERNQNAKRKHHNEEGEEGKAKKIKSESSNSELVKSTTPQIEFAESSAEKETEANKIKSESSERTFLDEFQGKSTTGRIKIPENSDDKEEQEEEEEEEEAKKMISEFSRISIFGEYPLEFAESSENEVEETEIAISGEYGRMELAESSDDDQDEETMFSRKAIFGGYRKSEFTESSDDDQEEEMVFAFFGAYRQMEFAESSDDDEQEEEMEFPKVDPFGEYRDIEFSKRTPELENAHFDDVKNQSVSFGKHNILDEEGGGGEEELSQPELGYSFDGEKLSRLPSIPNKKVSVEYCSMPFEQKILKTNVDEIILNTDEVEKKILPLLTREESEGLFCEGIPMKTYDGLGNCYMMIFQFRDDFYKLCIGWKMLFKDHKLYEDGECCVSVWMFRHKKNSKPCLAVKIKRI
ncbi:uncharacterized protein LOC125861663 [Solanum stenotomum]|uniref:uncharacterized protein LOC125861663 n=1 Tax=Solanum stenotomum TaxID=172797 RepID=UPI0020D1D3B7|nr:uncharacterized protein LOC125861663 [Solanum stenotomum]